MKQYIALLLLGFVVFTGCKKEENDTTVAPCQKGVLQVINQSGFKFDVEADNKQLGQLSGKQTLNFDLSKGTYYIKIIQFEGFVASPAVHEHNVGIAGCDTIAIVIPKTAKEQ